jgi:hypothetical protein
MLAFYDSILLRSVNTSALICNTMILKKFPHGEKLLSIVYPNGFNVGMKLSLSKNDKRFEEVLGSRFMLHQKYPCAPSEIIHNGKKETCS